MELHRNTSLSGLIFIMLMMQTFAFGRSLPWSLLPGELGRWLWIMTTVALIILVLRPYRGFWDRCVGLFSTRSAMLLWVLINIPYMLFNYFRFRDLGYAFPWIPLCALVVFLPAILSEKHRLLGAFALNLSLLAGSIVHFPIHPLRSDMLPVIEHALGQWSHGLNPYDLFELAGRSNRMGYLPGTLFLHLPAWCLGVDLRWNTFFYRSIWMLLAWLAVARLNKPDPAKSLLIFAALSPYMNFRHDLYFEGFILTAMIFVLFERGRALLLPFMVGTRQWAWVGAPFWALAQLKLGEGDKTRLRRWVAVTGGFFLITVILALMLWGRVSAKEFFRVIFWFQGAASSPEFGGDYGPTLAPLFFWLNLGTALQKVQAVVVGVLFVWAWRCRRDTEKVWSLGFTAWFFFLLLTPHYWLYFWNSWVFAAIAVVLRRSALEGAQ